VDLALEYCKECYSEQKSAILLNGSSHTHTMEMISKQLTDKDYGISLTSCKVLDDKGKPLTILAREFEDKRLLEAFYNQCTTPPDLGSLANNTVPLTLDCIKWLRGGGGWSKSKRYSHIQHRDARVMRKYNVYVSLLWDQMEYKYHSHRMLDKWAASEMAKHIMLRDFCREINKGFNHSHREGDKNTEFIKEIFAHAQSLIADRQFPPFEPVTLPPGIPDPLTLPEEEDEEE